MTTESPLARSVSPLLVDIKNIVFHGWDIKSSTLFDIAKNLEIVPIDSISEAANDLMAVRPRMPPLEAPALADWISEEAEIISNLRHRSRAKFGVLVNLCPTESASLQSPEHDEPDWRNLKGVSMRSSGVTPSRVYFRLAIEAGLHFVNFTPNVAETRDLRSLAEEKSILYCGRDGKTGQTFLKTVLAPALRDKNLRIDGWYSTQSSG
jgi:myo-inositol-1-phosphate synthase